MTLAERLRLTVVTDPLAVGTRDLEAVIAQVLEAGATSVQLRDKQAGSGALLPLARRIRALCHRHRALFIVNDRVDLALAANADGVHVGQEDLPVEEVRRLVPPHFVVGVSAETPDLARQGEVGGADYVGCGTVWPTDSKADAGQAVGVEGVRAVAAAISIPVVAIGGITPERQAAVLEAGAAGVAVIRAVLAAPDPADAVRRFLAGG
jgi:thiamine-phosphate pyrophosphorylase